MPSTKRRITILHPMSGVLKPGRLTLLLGPPSSGKTTLLKALSGKLPSQQGGDLQARRAAALAHPQACIIPCLGSMQPLRCWRTLADICHNLRTAGSLACACYHATAQPRAAPAKHLVPLIAAKSCVCTMQVNGSITYNGYGFAECVVGRTAAYVDQVDNHIAELTVRETLDFAARVQGAGFGARPVLARMQSTHALCSCPACGQALPKPACWHIVVLLAGGAKVCDGRRCVLHAQTRSTGCASARRSWASSRTGRSTPS